MTIKTKYTAIIASLLLILAMFSAQADNRRGYLVHPPITVEVTNNEYVTNEYVTNEYVTNDEISNYRISSGISDSDMANIIGSTLAGGSHQFDYSTTRWQVSLTGSTGLSDWDQDSNYSIGIAKRFGKDSFAPNALFHLGYTPVSSDKYIHGGATFVLDD